MIQVAIIEDTQKDADKLQVCLHRFAEETGEKIACTVFQTAIPFLEINHRQFDIVFMDIELPDIDGIKAARRFRQNDDCTILIFVTNLTQFVLTGYELDAMDYIVKPVKYPSFLLKMRRAVSRLKRRPELKLVLPTEDGELCIESSRMKYIEVYGHHLVYHTDTKDYEGYGTLKQVEKLLPAEGFFRCSGSYVVNMQYITGVSGMKILVGEARIPISRSRKKEFMQVLHQYYLCMK